MFKIKPTYHINGKPVSDTDFSTLADLYFDAIIGTPEKPVFLHPTFDITMHCPLACEYCFANSGPWEPLKTIPLPDIKHYTDAFQKIPAFKMVDLSGGEPLSAPTPYLSSVFEYSATHKNYIDIHTNGHFLHSAHKTAEIIDILKKYPRISAHGPSIQLSISSDSAGKTDYDKKFDFVLKILQDPELSGKIEPTLFVYGDSVAEYFKIMRERKLGIKPVKRNHMEKTGNNALLFELDGAQFGICDCNFIRILENGFAPNDGTWSGFKGPIHMINGVRNSAIAGQKNGHLSMEIVFQPDGTAGLIVDLLRLGKVPYKKPNGAYKSLPYLILEIANKLALETTDEGGAELRTKLKQLFENASIHRKKLCERQL